MGTWRKRLAGAVALLMAAFALTVPADAAVSRLCRQLEAQLASAGSGGGGSAQFKKYDKAVNAQRDQLSKARSRARSWGCTFSLFGGKQGCGAINTQIERMERNLDALQRKRTQLSGGGGGAPKVERARILASIEANGCRDQRMANRKLPGVAISERDGGSLFDRLFGGGIRKNGDYEGEGTVRRVLNEDSSRLYGPSGNFRTLCVRTCDGYYFPMSGSSSGRDFDRDAKNCETMCPGTEVQLYYHNATGEESDQMVSLATGEPYTALSTAFQYKQLGTERPAGCACNPAKNYALVGGDQTTTAALESEPVVPLPVTRPDPAADPETLANAEGGLDAATIGRLLKPRPTAVASAPAPNGEEAADRKVRVVGPMFLPDQEGAIDLRAPAQKRVQ